MLSIAWTHTEETRMRNAEITGWGKCMPPNVLTNHDLEQLVDTSDEWITTRTGIKERRISHVEASELAAVAGLRALAAAGKTVNDVDLILVATCSGDSIIPSTASVVQNRLEAWNAAAMDLNAACSGFVYGLVVGTNMIRGGTNNTVLLMGTEKLHFVTDYTDRTTCVLFGDGAGAVVLEPTDEPIGLLSSELGMDGSVGHILSVPRDGTHGDRRPVDPSECAIGMEGPEVFRRAVTTMGDSAARAIKDAGLSLDDIDLLIPHQANVRIIDATARRLGFDDGKVFVNIHSYGNTSAATIPVALTEALETGRISPGANIAFTAFGGGLSWGSAVYRWGRRVEPLGESDVDLPPPDRTTMELLQPNFDFFGLPEKLT
jgi:3-oxoacyl-[acyl-carrier-protein] synthase-3